MNYKVYLINLEKDKKRLDFMSNQLNDLGINFEKINAVYGKDYSGDEYDEDLAILKNSKKLSFGEIGCAISHKLAVQKFLTDTSLNQEIKYGLILEDDVQLDKSFKSILEKSIKDNEDYFYKNKFYNWEYLQFDYIDPADFWTKVWWEQIFATIKIQKSYLKKVFFVLKSFMKLPFVFCFSLFEILRSKIVIGPIKFYRDIYLAGTYLINKNSAQKLLSLSQKIVYPADRIQSEAKKQKSLKIKYYSPNVVFQKRGDFESNLANKS